MLKTFVFDLLKLDGLTFEELVAKTDERPLIQESLFRASRPKRKRRIR